MADNTIKRIDARRGKRGKRNTFSFSGVEAQEHIDNLVNEIRMTKSDLENYQSNASASAEAAAESAQQAGENAQGVADSAAAAAASATRAETYMNAASDSASSASNAAASASESEANAAAYAARTAQVEATLAQAENTVAEAKEVANTIEQKITGANEAAEKAEAAATTATTQASAAASSATTATEQANAASSSAASASDAATTASGYATSASTYASNAASSAEEAKKYAEQAGSGSGSGTGGGTAGVSSFNGRSGAVSPQSGDYTAAMVGALSSSDVTSTYSESGTAPVNGQAVASAISGKADTANTIKSVTISGTTVTITYGDGSTKTLTTQDTNTTYSNATTSTAGLMSASDKQKLNNIAAGATNVTVDSTLSATSTNPVQNKAVNSAIESLNTRVGSAETAVSDLADTAAETYAPKTDVTAIINEIGDLSNLTTSAKTNIIAAINEVAASGGSADLSAYATKTYVTEAIEGVTNGSY